MPTNTIENEQEVSQLSFEESEADFKPSLLCVGTVGEVGDAKISESEQYVVQPIKIEALDAGKSQTVYFLYRPEWLTAGFKPHSLKKTNKGAHFVYSKNIASKDSLSVLRGLAGTKEGFNDLANQLLRLPVVAGTGGPTMEAVTDTLRDFFAGNEDNEGQARKIGYELRQQATKVEGEFYTNEKGEQKQRYARENRYNLQSFWDVTTENLKRMKAKAEKSPVDEDSGKKKTIFTFGSELPF